MKPGRGSSRPPPGRNPKNQKNPGGAEVTESVPKRTGQEKWGPLTRSSILVLEDIVNLSVLTCVNLTGRQNEETQMHVNALKSRLVRVCTELRVPPVARRDFEASPGRLQQESRKSLDENKTFRLLESGLEDQLAALEEVEEQKRSVEQSCRSLRQQLEEEEEEAAEMLQLAERCVLHLPPPSNYTSTLQVTSGEAEGTARLLGEVLLTSEPLQDARHLLVHAGQYTDLLLSTGPTRDLT